MQLKYQWIESRKQQITKQAQDCQLQSKALFTQLFAEIKQKIQELAKLKDAIKQKTDSHQDQILRVSTQFKSLETLVATKQDQLVRLRQQLEQSSKSNVNKNEHIQQMTNKILQLQHSLLVLRDQSEKRIVQLTKQLERNQHIYREQMTQVTRSHQAQLYELQDKLNGQHEIVIAQLKKTNLKLIQSLEIENQTILSKGVESTKQNQSDYQRVVNQNKKLITSINELKLKTLNLEASLNATQQQLKIASKQTELIKDNFRRESEYLKDQKQTLKQKNKGLTQKIDQLAWEIRQLKLNKEEQIKKIQVKVDQSFKEVAEKAEEEVKKLEKHNQLLKGALGQKQKDIKELQQVSMKIKELFEQQQKELIQLKRQKEIGNKQQNVGPNLNKINQEMKSELIRKNCEIQVMQEQIKRLKAKINGVAKVQEEYAKFKEIMEKQNKMLLSEIVFLREKEKKSKKNDKSLNNSNILSDLNSQKSRVYEDVQQYKKIIQFMTQEMNEASKKIIQKDMKIEKLQAQIKRYQKQLQSR